MFEKKNLMLNCEVCDTRKIKEEDYSRYEQIMVNAEVVLASEESKSVLNRLPLIMNQESMIVLPENLEVAVKVINAGYKITKSTAVQEHTVMIANGPLEIEPGTEELLQKYEYISVNGPVTCPKSCEGLLNKMVVNGEVTVYPDDCVMVEETFVIDKYFPLRAKEGGKYYAAKAVMIKDNSVDAAKMVQKNVQFVTKRVILPETMLEDALPMFDEQAELVVVPAGMTLLYGDCVLSEELIRKEGNSLFVYGKLKVADGAEAEELCSLLEKLIVKGTLKLRKEQKEAFVKLGTEYDELVIIKNSRHLENMVKAKLDKVLFDNSPEGIEIANVAKVVLTEDVTPKMILEKLQISNCAKVECSEAQESAIAAVAQNVAKIGMESDEDDTVGAGGIMGALKSMANTKMVNAESYVM